jgi:hypothetical protein
MENAEQRWGPWDYIEPLAIAKEAICGKCNGAPVG